MTRKLCDVAMDCIVEAYDDGNRSGVWKSAIFEGDDEIVSLFDRIVGRCSSNDIKNPLNPDEIIVKNGEMITEAIAHKIERWALKKSKASIDHAKESRYHCSRVRINPATNSMVERSSVGIIAAQSIASPELS